MDGQAVTNAPAAVLADGARGCRFVDCVVRHVAGYGLYLRRGCRDCAVEECTFEDSGAGGVMIGETVRRTDDRERTRKNRVERCEVGGGGRVFHQAIGIWVGQSPDNIIARNEVHDLYYTAISVGWTWGYGESQAGGNTIEHNHLHHLGHGWLSDLGGIYTLGKQPGTVIRYNHINDVEGRHYGGWGVYLDEGSSGILVEHNLAYRTSHGGFHQHYGRDNVVRNNVFALGRDAQVRLTRAEPHDSFVFERNIVYGSRGVLAEGRWDEAKLTADRNLYWLGGAQPTFGKKSWEQWRQAGHDRHSLVADPLFVDPANGDFRLQPGSPARRSGFVPFNEPGAGPGRKR
jgi:hypothetical protein